MARGERQAQPSFRQVVIWALLSMLMAGAGVAAGYIAAQSAQDASAQDASAERALADPSPPRLLQVSDIFAAGLAEGRRAVRRTRVRQRRAGYRAGFAAGRKLARAAFATRYRPGGPAHRRIFVEGARAGERRALARFRFRGGGFYIVGVADGGRQVDASQGPLNRSDAYAVCRDGRSVCVRKAGP